VRVRIHEHTRKEHSKHLDLHDSTIGVIAKQVEPELKDQA